MPKLLYTRLPCIQYKIVIYTAAVYHAKTFIYTDCRASSIKLFTRQQIVLYTLLSCFQYEMDIYTPCMMLPCIQNKIVTYTAAVYHAKTFSIHGCHASSINYLHGSKMFYIHCCPASSIKSIFTRQWAVMHKEKVDKC